jgi:lipopolysaccharide biosynthesis glycosyltransferase
VTVEDLGDVLVKHDGATRRIHPRPESMDADVLVELFRLETLKQKHDSVAAADCPGLPNLAPFQPYFADSPAHKEPDYAYATLVTNPDYVMPAAVLMYSIAASGSQHARAILITDKVSERDARLLSVFAQVIRVDPIAAPKAVDNPRYAGVFTKLRAWELVMYKKVVFVDTDVVVVRNMDDLFDLPEWSVPVDASEKRYSTGMMVLQPNLRTFGAMMVDLAETDLDMELPDLLFLQDFFHRRCQRSGGHRLDLRDVDALGARVPLISTARPRAGNRGAGNAWNVYTDAPSDDAETDESEDHTDGSSSTGRGGGRTYGFARGRDVAVDGGHPLHKFDAKTSVINVMSRWYQVYSNVFNGRPGYMTRKQRAITIFDLRIRAIHYPGDTKPWRDYRKDPDRRQADETHHHLRLRRAFLPAMAERYSQHVCHPLALETRLQMRYEPFFWWYLTYVHLKRDMVLHADAIAGYIRDDHDLGGMAIGRSSNEANEATARRPIIPRLDATHHASHFDDEFPRPIVLQEYVGRLREKYIALRAHDAAEDAYASGDRHGNFNLNAKKPVGRSSGGDFVSIDPNDFPMRSCALTLAGRRFSEVENDQTTSRDGTLFESSDVVAYDLTSLDAVVLQLPQRQRVDTAQWKVSSDQYLWTVGWCSLSNFRQTGSRLCGLGDGVYAAQHAVGANGRCHLGFSQNFSLSLSHARAEPDGSPRPTPVGSLAARSNPPNHTEPPAPTSAGTATRVAAARMNPTPWTPGVLLESAAIMPKGAVKRIAIHVHCDPTSTDEHAVTLHPLSEDGIELVINGTAAPIVHQYTLHLLSLCGCRGGCGLARLAANATELSSTTIADDRPTAAHRNVSSAAAPATGKPVVGR